MLLFWAVNRRRDPTNGRTVMHHQSARFDRFAWIDVQYKLNLEQTLHSLLNNEALWYRSFGPPTQALALEQAEVGLLADGEVRVRMAAAPINPSDLIPITGAYSHRLQPPLIAGYEGVGVVVEADGSVADLVGRRVLPLRGTGTWQRYVDCIPTWLVMVPDDIGPHVAARAYINPLTALLMLDMWPVTGKRSPVDRRWLDIAIDCSVNGRSEAGAREVVSVSRSQTHGETLAALGLIPLSMDDRAAILSNASRTDVVFDAVGGRLAEMLLTAMPSASDFVSYGLLSGVPYRPPARGRPLSDSTCGIVWERLFLPNGTVGFGGSGRFFGVLRCPMCNSFLSLTGKRR